jgi:hypothetical protein
MPDSESTRGAQAPAPRRAITGAAVVTVAAGVPCPRCQHIHRPTDVEVAEWRVFNLGVSHTSQDAAVAAMDAALQRGP